jgi:ketosteroid isomerase-like protein
MPNYSLPSPIDRYFAAKESSDVEDTLACFAEDATVWDNGEDLELKGIEQIRKWMTGTVAGYKLTSEVKSGESRGEEFVAGVVVSGDFPGSPYEFAYRFKIRGDKIAELAIDPIGSLA